MGGLLFGLWSLWFTLAEVTVYETSVAARLESLEAARPLEADVDGRVVAVFVGLDDEVAEGDVILELDASDLELQLQEVEARHSALLATLGAATAHRDAIQGALDSSETASSAAIAEARSWAQEAAAAARLAEADRARAEALAASGSLSSADHERAIAEADQKRAEAEALLQGVRRVGFEGELDRGDRQSVLQALEQEVARLTGELGAAEAAIARLDREVERHQLRAPVTGRIGAISTFQPGDFLPRGARVGAVVPDGPLRVVAWFEPRASVGRIRPGMPAHLRLDGFPWIEYGSLPAAVDRVASEPTDGRIRVELAIGPTEGSAIPAQHGLEGEVEVAIEAVSPATLVLRAAGNLARKGQ